jgi:hypothetical protein
MDMMVTLAVIYEPWVGLYTFMVLNATFNNISVISQRSVLLVEETGGPRENHQPAANHKQTLSHNVDLTIPVPNVH